MYELLEIKLSRELFMYHNRQYHAQRLIEMKQQLTVELLKYECFVSDAAVAISTIPAAKFV